MKPLVIQFMKYMVGGASYFWSGLAVFAFFYSAIGWDWLPAKMVGDAVGWSANYLIQRYWAFEAPGLRRREGVVMSRYVSLTMVNLLLDYLIIASLKAVGVSPYIGFFISAAFFTIWNYLWYRAWVFYSGRINPKQGEPVV